MIPKIIYYCWFGGQKPEAITKRIQTWKTLLADYQIIEINESNFDYSQYDFTKKAYEAKKYAYVSDVARLAFLKETGGIYLDTDVDVLKPFTPFLESEQLQLSMEYYGFEITGVNVGTIIAPKAHPIIISIFDTLTKATYTNKRPTINQYFNQALPTLRYRNCEQQFPNDKTHIYKAEVFCKQSSQSTAVHLYDNSWGEKLSTLQKGKRLCGVMLKKIIGRKGYAKLFSQEENDGKNT